MRIKKDLRALRSPFQLHNVSDYVSNLIEDDLELVVASLLRSSGFDVERQVSIKGESGTRHEVDIYAEKGKLLSLFGGHSLIAEVKVGTVPRETLEGQYAVFEDISKRNKMDRLMVVTNDKFADDALQYADSKGISLLDRKALSNLLLLYGTE